MANDVPTLPVYEKPKERPPAPIPASLPKPPSSLNRLMGKMLKPNLKRLSHLPTKKKHKMKFY